MTLGFLAASIVECLIYEVFLYTRLFSGPEQFAVQQLSYFMLDLYFMVYCPYKWIGKSTRDSWAGWGQRGKRGKYFNFVRKPDPREELIRKGYFVKTAGHFAYLRRKRNMMETIMEKKLRNIKNEHSVYVIIEPEDGPDISMSTAYDWGVEGD